MICHDRKLIMIHIPRTGGSSVEHLLMGKDWWDVNYRTKHLTTVQAKQHYEEYWDEYTTFTIFRTFIERSRSSCRAFNEVHCTFPFDYWIQEPVDWILNFERLSDDWRVFAECLGLPTELPHVGRTQ